MSTGRLFVGASGLFAGLYFGSGGTVAKASGDGVPPGQYPWSHDGFFGSFDHAR